MIFTYYKYSSIQDFIKDNPKGKKEQEFTIINKCNGYNFKSNDFNDNCFFCNFCYFSDKNITKKYLQIYQYKKIQEISNSCFNGTIVKMPNSKIIGKKKCNLESFSSYDETSNIQPWAAGILKSITSNKCRISMEVPVFNNEYDRNGRIDICAITDKHLLVIESKTSLDDALKDERFIEQREKYTKEIRMYSKDYTYLTLFGGKETDLLPPTSPYCTGCVGNKSERFYKFIMENNIKFISAAALWCMSCKFINNKLSWDIFIKTIFNNNQVLGLTSAGLVSNRNNNLIIKKI